MAAATRIPWLSSNAIRRPERPARRGPDVRAHHRALRAADRGALDDALGELASFGTAASMIALINSVVAGAGVTLLVHVALGGRSGVALTALFLFYERWRLAHDPGVHSAQSLQDELAR